METKPFEPKGDAPEWQLVYDVISQKNINDIVTHEELSEALGRDFLANRSPFYKAQKVMLEQKLRALSPVLGIGYRVVEAKDHERLARKEHKSGRRKVKKALGLVKHADRSEMTPEVRQKFDAIQVNLAGQDDFIRRIDIRTQRHETAIRASQENQRALEDKVESQDERVARLEDQQRRLAEAMERKGIV